MCGALVLSPTPHLFAGIWNPWETPFVSYQSEIKIHFDDADPAGICFFGQVFAKTHQVYEEFVGHLGQNPQHFFSGKEFIVPIRHTEANYLAPLVALETYSVDIGVSKISDSSFTLEYKIAKADKLCAAIATTHVFLEAKSHKKCLIPTDFKTGLEKFKIL